MVLSDVVGCFMESPYEERYPLFVIRYRFTVVRGQSSVVSCPLSVLTADRRRLTAGFFFFCLLSSVSCLLYSSLINFRHFTRRKRLRCA
jgi:hypothetical protein